MRLALESERERELKQTVANLSREIQQLKDKLSTGNTTKRMFKETGASKLALKLGDMEAELQGENAKPRNTIPHMQKKLKQNDISKKQNIIEAHSVRHNDKKIPVAVLSDPTKPELNIGRPTVISHMPDLEGVISDIASNGSIFRDDFSIPTGTEEINFVHTTSIIKACQFDKL